MLEDGEGLGERVEEGGGGRLNVWPQLTPKLGNNISRTSHLEQQLYAAQVGVAHGPMKRRRTCVAWLRTELWL
jgi:hypothetical protein